MENEKYSNYPLSISAILGLIEAKDIAIPEIQRPFVWKKTQVRDLIDSLYKGYPTGYIILWKNPNVKLKDGTISAGKKVLIDGQQRITALMTAIAGLSVFNSEYRKERIKIAFNPLAAKSEELEDDIFAVSTPAISKSRWWIPDIAELFSNSYSSFKFIPKYCQDNPEMQPEELEKIISRVKGIANRMIGVIELSENLGIDIVTDIFIRINSKGTALSQGDFVMSKIAADEIHGGNTLRKVIDYFSHLSIVPSFYDRIAENDADFAATEYLQKLEWLKDDNETVYDPGCDDVIRVAFMHKLKRAKLADLVSLLSGRNFETRAYNEEIIEHTYELFREGVLNVINEYNFKQFMIAIRSAGFISPKMVNSNMALDFAYTIYLLLKESNEVPVEEIKRIVQKWYVLSVLTGRYSSSPESAFARDIRRINENGVIQILKEIEDAELSENFWNIALVQNLSYTSTNNPTYLVFLAAQVFFNDVSFLSNNVPVRELISLGGDVHHIFPKQYLIDNGLDKTQYNQEANYVFLDRPVNISIGKKAPNIYLKDVKQRCLDNLPNQSGLINSIDNFYANLETNCVPVETLDMDYISYDEFLAKRRKLMADKIKKYYNSL
ncbi:MAG: DUF262 domain-containing protein [Paludibacteraceae bacterium]|nr:DUF262 domain-containing protein [Paludibacteraceae bacterium]